MSGADKYCVYRGTSASSQAKYLESTSTSFAYKGASELSGTPASSGTKWTVKNTLELKNAARVTVDGNLFENSWAAGQAGYAIVLTPRNSGKAPWSKVQDITFTNNLVRHVAAVVNISGYDNTATTLRTERITFRNNLFDDVSHTAYGTGARAILVGDGAAYLVFDANTLIHTNTAAVYAYGAAMPGFVFTNNLMRHNTYGINGDGTTVGKPTIAKYFPSGVVRCNILAGGTASLYPTPNGFPTVAQWNVSFVAPAIRRLPADSEQPRRARRVPGDDSRRESHRDSRRHSPATIRAPDPANEPPVADAGGPYTAAVGALVSTDGTQSSDPDGSVLDYRWHWGDEVLVRAADLPATALRGSEWVRTDQSDAAGGEMILNPDKGGAKRSVVAAPASYVEFTVNAAAGVPYYLWMRLRASGNAYANDSLTLQFSGAVDAQGAPLARIGTTNGLAIILEQGREAGVAGWGWTDSVYDGVAAPVYFAQSGTQTIRIQQREDGVGWDQLVLSSAVYTARPGAAKNDQTHIDEDFGTSTGVSAVHRYARAGVYPLVLVVTDADGAVAKQSTTVTVK